MGQTSSASMGRGRPPKLPSKNEDGAPCMVCGATENTLWYSAFDADQVKHWMCAGNRLQRGTLVRCDDQSHKQRRNSTGNRNIEDTGWTPWRPAAAPTPQKRAPAKKKGAQPHAQAPKRKTQVRALRSRRSRSSRRSRRSGTTRLKTTTRTARTTRRKTSLTLRTRGSSMTGPNSRTMMCQLVHGRAAAARTAAHAARARDRGRAVVVRAGLRASLRRAARRRIPCLLMDSIFANAAASSANHQQTRSARPKPSASQNCSLPACFCACRPVCFV